MRIAHTPRRWRAPSLRALLVLLAVVVLVICLEALILARSRRPGAVRERIADSAALAGFAHGPVQVYFTRPRYPDTGENRGGLDESLAADIDASQSSVELAAFDFDLPSLTAALTRAKQRGVAVRAVLDGQNLEDPATARRTGALQRAGVPITFDRRPAFMHNKFVILDASVVWTGSWNPTANDTFRNNNNMLRLADARIAANYRRKFDLLFAGHSGPGYGSAAPYPDVTLDSFHVVTAFAPDSDITAQVVSLIDRAKLSVDFLAFSFTSDPLEAALVSAHTRGVQVRGVVERRNARGSGSALPRFQSAGLDVQEDGNCYLMHHKALVIDGRTVVTGSFNWTRHAQQANDENVVIVDSQWLARRFEEEFGRIYEQALRPMRCAT
jgi:phosphatidylserine/phosphatidylglycerophosphate/cardiolipin synthase-like enzyme